MPKISFKRWAKIRPAKYLPTALVLLFSIGLLLYRLVSLQVGPNNFELEALKRIEDISLLLRNPIDFVYYSVSWALSFIFSDLTSLRLSSTIFAILTLVSTRNVIKYWSGTKTANIGALVLSASFWFILMGRIGSPLIMPAFWLSLILDFASRQRYTNKQKTFTWLIGVAAVIGVYSPYFIWWLVALSIVLAIHFGTKAVLLKLKTPLIILPLLLIIPLIVASLNADVAKEIVGISDIAKSPLEYLGNILQNMSQLIIRGSFNPLVNLGRLPYLDIFQSLMLCLGLSVFYLHRKSLRGLSILLAPLLYIGIVSVFTVSQSALVVLMPITFIMISIGISEFINMWLKGFPRNPIGRSAGVLLCVVLISISGYYNVHRYFVAWAKNPDVNAAHKQLK